MLGIFPVEETQKTGVTQFFRSTFFLDDTIAKYRRQTKSDEKKVEASLKMASLTLEDKRNFLRI